jgi:glycine cleavage system transcriptional repressor
MTSDIVLTLTGPDRVGIVNDVTEILLTLGGNVETSRMMRLGGEFAVLMLVSLSQDALGRTEAAFAGLASQGYKLTTVEAGEPRDSHRGWLAYRIEVQGADHEGIIHEVAHELSRRGITIESADTATDNAPLTATPLFSMTALVLAPPDLDEAAWRAELDAAARLANVDVAVSRAEDR